MGIADLHIHSTYSYDSTSSISAILEWASTATDLDVIAITDHDKIDGALEAQDQASRYGLEVVPGIEITCSEGHLLALYVDRPIPAHRPAIETVLRIGELGGLCIAAHPQAFMVHGINATVLNGILEDPDAAKVLVGLECMNAGLWFPRSNELTRQKALEKGLSRTGGSDSHLFWTIGSGFTRFPGYSAQDLRQALVDHTTESCRLTEERSLGYYAGHFIHYALRRLGWATCAPRQNARLVVRRLSKI